MTGARVFLFGLFRFLPERQLLLHGDAPVRIGGRALDILTALVERPGELLSKTDLMARAWPNTTVDESNLKVNMASLRRALEDDADAVRYIATVTGRGYRFVAPVEACAAPGTGRAEAVRGARDSSPLSRSIAIARDRSAGSVHSGFEDLWARVRLVDLPHAAANPIGGSTEIRDLLDIAGYGIVIDGEMTLQFEGTVVLLKPGSVVARHDPNCPTPNLSRGPCRILFVRL